MGIARVQERLAVLLAPDLELGQRMVLMPLDQQQVAGRDVLDLLLERRLALPAQLVHDHPALVGHDHHLAASRRAVTIRVLAGLVDVEAVVRVLDHGHAQAALHEARDELLDERGLAAPRPPGEAEYLHPPIVSGRHSLPDIAVSVTPGRGAHRYGSA